MAEFMGRASNTFRWRRRRTSSRRNGKVLALLVVLVPSLFAIVALVIDGAGMMAQSQIAQHAADAAATAAAMDLFQGGSAATANATATQFVESYNLLATANVTVNIPPTSGAFAGRPTFVEVIVSLPAQTFFVGAMGSNITGPLVSRAVAGYQISTSGTAVMVLDPSPPQLSTAVALPQIPSLPAILGGLEVLGAGDLQAQGAVLVNNEWGGVDQNGNPAGANAGPPYAVSCTPVASTTRLLATDIRVVGGVDNPKNYGNVSSGKPSPLQANKLPVADPWLNLPVPTLAVDSANVYANTYGSVSVVQLPLGPPRTLKPGVYDWIEVVSGQVIFSPGVYIIRGANPTTGVGLSLVAGQVTADDVMFYITDTASYSPAQGTPDALDGSTQPPAPSVTTLVPSVVIDATLPGCRFSPISSSASPFAGIMIFQRRFDRRPIVLLQQPLIGSGTFAGTVYAKWGHVMFVGGGTITASFAAGTIRVVELLDMTISPPSLMPAVQEVFLVE
jgi:Flp pilus assembly protein TadG